MPGNAPGEREEICQERRAQLQQQQQ
jgi:hypothetical protein